MVVDLDFAIDHPLVQFDWISVIKLIQRMKIWPFITVWITAERCNELAFILILDKHFNQIGI